MKRSKLFALLKTLNKQEFYELGQFVKSPLHQKDKDAQKLYTQIKKYFPEFESEKLTKEHFAKLLYGGDSKKEMNRLNLTMFKLAKATEDYLLWNKIQSSDYQKGMVFLDIFEERKLDKFFHKTVDDLKSILEQQTKIDVNYYLKQFILNKRIYFHSHSQKFSTTIEKLEQQTQALDLFYFTSKLNAQLVLLNRGGVIMQEKRNLLFVDEIQQFLKKDTQFEDILLLKIYDFFINSLSFTYYYNKEEYLNLKKLIFDNISQFSDFERNDIIILLLQYTLRLYSLGDESFLKEQFEVYQFAIKYKILYKHGYFMPFGFYNIVQVACELGELDWTDNFIKKYINDVYIEERKNIENSARAYWSCSIGEYDDTLVYLREIDYKKNYYYDIVVKTLTIRVFFEQNESVLLMDYINTFYAFVRRHTQMSEELKERLSSYARFVKALNTKKVSKNNLLEQLAKEKNIYFRTWLFKKINSSA